MELLKYITENFGTQRDFAKHMQTSPQHVNYWIKKEFIVFNGCLYRPIKMVE